MFQVRLILSIIFLGFVVSLAVVGDDDKKKDDLPEFLKPIAEANTVTLYSIDGKYKKNKEDIPKDVEKFHDYPVLGKLELKSTEVRRDLNLVLLNGTRDSEEGGDCFFPRHALRAQWGDQTTDYVICFECGWIKVIQDQKSKLKGIKNEPKDFFNRLLKQANIPIVP